MAFTVPNEASASYTDQAELDAVDLQIIANGFAGTGVISGCAVTAQGSPDGTVAVSSGSIRVNGTTVAVTGANVSVMTGSANADGTTATVADATYYRYDLIVVNGSGQLGVLHGTLPAPAWPDYSVNPVFPTIAASYAVLAACLIPPTAAAITGIATSQIVRKDLVYNVNGFHDAGHALSGANHTGDVATSQMPQLTAWSTYVNATSSTADPTTAHVLFTPITFAKSGVLAITTGAFRWYNDTGRTLTFDSTRASVSTAPTGAALIVDINKDGTTIFTNQALRPEIAISGFTDQGSTPSVTTIANTSYLTVDIDQIGSTVPGSDLTVQIWLKG
jgi:hypothetical protein